MCGERLSIHNYGIIIHLTTCKGRTRKASKEAGNSAGSGYFTGGSWLPGLTTGSTTSSVNNGQQDSVAFTGPQTSAATVASDGAVGALGQNAHKHRGEGVDPREARHLLSTLTLTLCLNLAQVDCASMECYLSEKYAIRGWVSLGLG